MRLGLTREAHNRTAILGRLRSFPVSGVALQAVNSVLLAVPIVSLVALGYRQRWISEDAFISLRVVQQIMAGHGPVFNTGERIEAHTNPLWVGILTVFGFLGVDIVMAALYLGIGLSAAGMLAAIAASTALEHRRPGRSGNVPPMLFIPVGAVVFTAVPVTADFITSGLETGLAFGWLGFSFWILVRAVTDARKVPDWHWYAGALVLGLGPLVRPDFAIYSAGFLLALLLFRHWSRDVRLGIRDVLLIGIAAGTIPVLYQIFRMGFYAALVPNTALAKEASMSNWAQGAVYLRDFVEPYWLWIPGAILLAWLVVRLVSGLRQRQWPEMVLLAVPVLTGILHAVYIIRVGGDFMHGRMLLPALFAITLPFAVVGIPLTSRPLALLSVLVVIPVLVWSYFAVSSFETTLGPELDEETGLVDERAFYVEKGDTPNPVTHEDYMKSDFRGAKQGVKALERLNNGPPAIWLGDGEYPIAEYMPDEIKLVVPDGNIGILSYIAGLDVHTVDRMGLADPFGARMELEERTRPGHEKMLPIVWVSARNSALTPEDVDSQDFRDAEAALECRPLADLHEAVTAPLSLDRFIKNIQQSWEFHNLRIPPEPAEARERFC